MFHMDSSFCEKYFRIIHVYTYIFSAIKSKIIKCNQRDQKYTNETKNIKSPPRSYLIYLFATKPNHKTGHKYTHHIPMQLYDALIIIITVIIYLC